MINIDDIVFFIIPKDYAKIPKTYAMISRPFPYHVNKSGIAVRILCQVPQSGSYTLHFSSRQSLQIAKGVPV